MVSWSSVLQIGALPPDHDDGGAAQSSPPHCDPHTTFCVPASQDTVVHAKSAQLVPHALHRVPSPVSGLRPQEIGPAARVASPHVTSGDHALAPGVSTPPVTRRFPQISWRLHRRRDGMRRRRWRREKPGELDRAPRVEEPGALGQRVVAVAIRGVLKNRLDRIGGQRRVGLQHQRDGPGDDRRRLAGPAQTQVREVRRGDGARQQGRRPRRVEAAGRIAQRLEADAGRDDVGFGRVIYSWSDRAN